MGHPAGHGSHGLHLRGLTKLLFEAREVPHVPGHLDVADDPARTVDHGRDRGLFVGDVPVLATAHEPAGPRLSRQAVPPGKGTLLARSAALQHPSASADHLVGGIAGDRLDGEIHAPDRPVSVSDRDPLGGVLDRRRQAPLLLP